MSPRTPDILRKSHVHATGKARARGKAGLRDELAATVADEAALLIDLDGVLYAGNRELPGARATVAWLRSEHVPLLMTRPAPAFVALGMTRYWQAPDGLRLDTAPFVAALEHAAGAQPVVVGKPAPEFFAAALAELGTRAADTWMVGDDIRVDIDGARAAGLHTLLVKTGKFRLPDLGLGIAPDAVLDSIADLPRWWMTNGRA